MATVGQGLAIAGIANMLKRSLNATSILHFQSEWAPPANFDERGNPDYLAADSGVFDSGIRYRPNPQNPLKGIFCPAKRNPFQAVSGIYYQADVEIYVLEDLGSVFVLDGKYPKRQDAFEALGRRYYATAPAFPCAQGDLIVAWKISAALERYPVQN
jgi:hypothetical protein